MPLHQSHSHSLLITTTFTLIFSLLTTSGHYTPPPSSSALLSDWHSARATYYAATDPRDIVGGACGFGDLEKAGYGKATVGLSTALFSKGQICGACFEVRCVEDLRNCIPGTSILVTATNFCAPNYGFTADGGGKCNPPNKHFVLPIEAFEKIALWKAGNMAVQYRRYNAFFFVCYCFLFRFQLLKCMYFLYFLLVATLTLRENRGILGRG